MGTYAVTGSASGMGRAAADKLRAAGHTVIGVDLADAEVNADLSAGGGRREAAEAVLAAAGDHLDGAVLAAGIGPVSGRERAIAQVNYLGAVDLLRTWRPALREGKVVVFASNSTTATPLVPRRAVRALLADDPDRAVRSARMFGRAAPLMVYAATKLALTRWVRRNAVRPEWAGEGIRLNALAPGAVRTPLLERQLAEPVGAKAFRSFPVPIGGFGDPDQLGDWVVFLLSDAADFLVGSVLFVDGGSDAYLRPDAWPQPVRLPGLVGYVRRMREFARRRAG
ncbi:SDR family oxidoreductase [Saccharopolyspora griseoalba]|uniref:SDR family oxidoreductase n=1 Tax=Saccharopolyspora griseoalba TaxID=1431848 RepID=A0ABW2LVS8_9PSEU